jgi:hypothetical protein
MSLSGLALLVAALGAYADDHIREITNDEGVHKIQVAQSTSRRAETPGRTQARHPNFPVRWWPEIGTKPLSWFRTEEGVTMAENILTWQDHGTGWPLMNTTREAFTGDESRAGPWGMHASPLWARFYEIGTNRPVFAGRDGVIKYNMAEIEQERRTLYAWYTRSGTTVFRRYEQWKYAQNWDNAPPTNTDESKVRSYTLPDPLITSAGELVTSVAMWEEKRRPEILRLFEQHQEGVTPTDKIETEFEIVERDVPGMGGVSRRTQARIHFPGHEDAPVIRVLLNVPVNAGGPVPTLLHLSFSPNVLVLDEPGIDEGMAWDTRARIRVPDREARLIGKMPAQYLVERGYGVALVYYGDIEPDFDHAGKYGVRSLFGADGGEREPDEWGSIGAWSWGLSRVLDYLQTDPAVDGEQVALSGASRLGKTVLWAAAQDQRFAMAIPMISGEGGGAISRRNYGETVADLTNPRRYDYWFAPRYADYAFDVDALPVDGHMLLSLIAPRPLLQIVGTKDTWSDPQGEWVAANAASPVYELYGLESMEGEASPVPDSPILKDMGFFLHEGEHTTLPIDYEVMADFMDKRFTRPQPR